MFLRPHHPETTTTTRYHLTMNDPTTIIIYFSSLTTTTTSTSLAASLYIVSSTKSWHDRLRIVSSSLTWSWSVPTFTGCPTLSGSIWWWWFCTVGQKWKKSEITTYINSKYSIIKSQVLKMCMWVCVLLYYSPYRFEHGLVPFLDN